MKVSSLKKGYIFPRRFQLCERKRNIFTVVFPPTKKTMGDGEAKGDENGIQGLESNW